MIRALPLVVLLSACTDFPEVGQAEAEWQSSSVTPSLLTSEELARIQPNVTNAAAGLPDEAAALRARAERLRRK